MKRCAKDTEETRKANESKDLDFSAQRAIAGFEFAAPSAKDDFFRIIRRSIEKAQDGKIYSREGYSLTDFARKEFEKRTWFQAPPNISGSGAHSGAHGPSSISLEDIKPGMSSEQRAQAYADLKRVLGR